MALLPVTSDRDGRRHGGFLCPPYDQQLPVGDDIAVAGTMTERVVIDLLQPTAHKLFSRLYRRSEGQTITVDLGTPDVVPLFGLVWAVLICVIKLLKSVQTSERCRKYRRFLHDVLRNPGPQAILVCAVALFTGVRWVRRRERNAPLKRPL